MSRFAFDGARHDRAAHLRATSREVADVRVMVLGGEHVATVDGPGLAWLSADEAPEGEWLWLGEAGGRGHAAVVVDGRVPDELNGTSIRVLAPQLPPDELSLAVHAVAIARWLAATPFCPRCGSRTEIQQAGHLRHCPECGASHFPRTDPAVIMLITDDQDRALLGRNPAWPEGRFSTLAGFVEPGESLEDAVRREVREEVGVTVGEVTYGASQPWPFPASLMLGFFGKATEATIDVDQDEIAEAAWVTREELVRYGEAGTLLLPPSGVSISSWLIETWLGQDLTASW
ncbi:NAD(+) diphosphatase [Aeromicrobium sp. Leaf350]|uniref:NAD(+) diphosphatase n=1 Tax=Aeromicrobium sp. Leaf350 TaxID=2876565 RepID=UPI001E2C124D|nr:NAD(+) diphosphatase [Aeromicrobium sp. Leaf350]